MRKARVILPLVILAAVAAYLVWNNMTKLPANGPGLNQIPTTESETPAVSVTKPAPSGIESSPTPAEDLSAEIQKAFAEKYGKPADTYIVRVVKSSDAYAKGSIDFKDEAGGGLWFAAKTDAGWELVFDGNGIIDCATADKYGMPADYVPGCVDTNKGNEFIERQ